MEVGKETNSIYHTRIERGKKNIKFTHFGKTPLEKKHSRAIQKYFWTVLIFLKSKL